MNAFINQQHDPKKKWNPKHYKNGETVLYEQGWASTTGTSWERVIVDEVLDDEIAIRWEGDWGVFTVPYDAVKREGE